MATRHISDEAAIRQRIDQHVEAIRALDLDRVMSIYAPNIVSFDLEPPLQYVGTVEKRKPWINLFAIYRVPLGYEVPDLALTVGDDVAFGHSLNRLSGRLKAGKQTASWVRWTTCFRKIEGEWLIAHEQVSVPVDPGSGKALLELEP